MRLDVLADGLARMLAGPDDGGQRRAAATAVLRRFAVVAGGPGTGKTTTVARIVALLAEQAAAAGAAAPHVALAAPTGKAAARLEEAVHAAARELDADDAVREQLLALGGVTLHRLLGWQPRTHSRFRHHRGNRLPHDVVVVDETSMVSLSLMGRLVEAVRPEARLILVGDPGQLTSIEAGAVLGDIVGPAADGPRMRAPARACSRGRRARASPGGPSRRRRGRRRDRRARPRAPLRRGHRRAGVRRPPRRRRRRGRRPRRRAGGRDVAARSTPPTRRPRPRSRPCARGAVAAARDVIEAARAGDAARALGALGAFRLLCAHRRGAHGVATWMARVESWLAAELDGVRAPDGAWYAGRPLLVTENDYGLRLNNGDTGRRRRDGRRTGSAPCSSAAASRSASARPGSAPSTPSTR